MKGVGVALVTPFTEDGAVDYTALTHLVEHVIAGGVDYLVVLGTTAETPDALSGGEEVGCPLCQRGQWRTPSDHFGSGRKLYGRCGLLSSYG